MGVLAAHYGSPGGAAQGIGDESVLKGHALVLQHGARLWHVLEVIFAHVIGEDEDDVGFRSERLNILGLHAQDTQREQQSYSGSQCS
jgi:hypothetical protein